MCKAVNVCLMRFVCLFVDAAAASLVVLLGLCIFIDSTKFRSIWRRWQRRSGAQINELSCVSVLCLLLPHSFTRTHLTLLSMVGSRCCFKEAQHKAKLSTQLSAALPTLICGCVDACVSTCII